MFTFVLAQFDGIDGFLGTRGSIMLDFVFLAMIGVMPIMGLSIYLVKYRGKYELHKKIQITLGLVLLLTVTAFEVDMRFFTDWEQRAEPSPWYQPGTWNGVWYSLCVHLLFAIPTPLLWIYVIVKALRKFPSPAAPNEYSRTHIFWARLAATGTCMTSVTGWVFYWIAFVMK